MNRLKRFLSSFVVLILLFQAAAAHAADESVPADEQAGFTAGILYNGAAVSSVKEGEIFTLRFSLSGIAPTTVIIPLRWDPAIAQVVDPKTGEPVSNGLKKESDMLTDTGFTVGEKCYDKSEDFLGTKLWWNGLPQFSDNPDSDDGYPYINQETGFYKLLYYVYIPTLPSEPQAFLDISFRALKSGNPGFRFATAADGEGMSEEEAKQHYDLAATGGLETLHVDSQGEAVVEIYTDKTTFPDVRIISDEDLDKPVEVPRPSGPTGPVYTPTVPSGNSGSGGSAESDEPKEVQYLTDMVDAKSLDGIFPYESADKIQAQIQMTEEMTVDDNSEYMVSPGAVIDYLNELTDVPNSVIFTMPDKLIDREEYLICLDGMSLYTLVNAGIPMVYVETPYGYIGINPAVLVIDVGPHLPLKLRVSPAADGILAELLSEDDVLEGFSGNIFRIILPYKASDPQKQLIVTSDRVFGSSDTGAQPLVSRYDDGLGALIFLASCTGEFAISERSRESFTDLSEVPWAAEAIDGLATAAIVQGAGDGRFLPQNNVTREQFAKMIVSTTAMYQTNPVTSFTDITADNIFFPYVASANLAGLVNGISNTEFGGSDFITRQDLATICYRAVQLLGIELPELRTETLFADDAQISGYARDAVYALYKAGIIDGTGSGFEPLGNTTRAAAAKILYGICPYLRELI